MNQTFKAVGIALINSVTLLTHPDSSKVENELNKFSIIDNNNSSNFSLNYNNYSMFNNNSILLSQYEQGSNFIEKQNTKKGSNTTNFSEFNVYESNESFFIDRIKKYKNLFVDFDENRIDLLDMLKEDKKRDYFSNFIEFVFKKDNYYISDSFLSLFLESEDMSVSDKPFYNALQICSKSSNAAIARKAKSMLNYFFKKGAE